MYTIYFGFRDKLFNFLVLNEVFKHEDRAEIAYRLSHYLNMPVSDYDVENILYTEDTQVLLKVGGRDGNLRIKVTREK